MTKWVKYKAERVQFLFYWFLYFAHSMKPITVKPEDIFWKLLSQLSPLITVLTEVHQNFDSRPTVNLSEHGAQPSWKARSLLWALDLTKLLSVKARDAWVAENQSRHWCGAPRLYSPQFIRLADINEVKQNQPTNPPVWYCDSQSRMRCFKSELQLILLFFHLIWLREMV